MVCFWYDFRATSKMAWKCEEAAVTDGVRDMIGVATAKELINLLVRAGMRIVNAGERVCTASPASDSLRRRRTPKVIDAQIMSSASRIRYGHQSQY